MRFFKDRTRYTTIFSINLRCQSQNDFYQRVQKSDATHLAALCQGCNIFSLITADLYGEFYYQSPTEDKRRVWKSQWAEAVEKNAKGEHCKTINKFAFFLKSLFGSFYSYPNSFQAMITGKCCGGNRSAAHSLSAATPSPCERGFRQPASPQRLAGCIATLWDASIAARTKNVAFRAQSCENQLTL